MCIVVPTAVVCSVLHVLQADNSGFVYILQADNPGFVYILQADNPGFVYILQADNSGFVYILQADNSGFVYILWFFAFGLKPELQDNLLSYILTQRRSHIHCVKLSCLLSFDREE